MTPVLVVLLSLPCVYWTDGIESRAALEAAGVKRVCVAPEQVETWRAAGFAATALTAKDLASRGGAAHSRDHRARRSRLAHAQPVD